MNLLYLCWVLLLFQQSDSACFHNKDCHSCILEDCVWVTLKNKTVICYEYDLYPQLEWRFYSSSCPKKMETSAKPRFYEDTKQNSSSSVQAKKTDQRTDLVQIKPFDSSLTKRPAAFENDIIEPRRIDFKPNIRFIPNRNFSSRLNFNKRVKRNLCHNIRLYKLMRKGKQGHDALLIEEMVKKNPMLHNKQECEYLLEERKKQQKRFCPSCSEKVKRAAEPNCHTFMDCKSCVGSCFWVSNITISWCAYPNETIPEGDDFIQPGGEMWCKGTPNTTNESNFYGIAFWILFVLFVTTIGTAAAYIIKKRRQTESAMEMLPLTRFSLLRHGDEDSTPL